MLQPPQTKGLTIRYVLLNTVICLRRALLDISYPRCAGGRKLRRPEQKIYSSITIHPDMNILPLHLHTARRITPLTENKCIIRGSSAWSFKVFCSVFTGRVVSAPTPRSPAALAALNRARFLSAHLNDVADTAGPASKSHAEMKNVFLTLLAKCPHHNRRISSNYISFLGF